MRITNFFLVIMIIMLPLLLYSEWRADDTSALAKINKQYDSALTTATQDATQALRTTVVPQQEAGYDSDKINPANDDVALKTFLRTMALNFQTEDTYNMDLMSRYIPVFAVLENDGLALNVYQNHTDKEGNNILERTWLPKIPFSYADNQGNIINFSVDQNIELYVKSYDEWYEGTREEVLKELTEDVETGDLEEDEKVPTLADKLPDELKSKLQEALSEELFNTLMSSLETLISVEGIPSELQEQISEEGSFELLDELLTALSDDDEDYTDGEDNGEGGVEGNLQTKLPPELLVELQENMPEELFTSFMEELAKHTSAFDVPAEILDAVDDAVSDELFIKLVTALANTVTDDEICDDGSDCEESDDPEQPTNPDEPTNPTEPGDDGNTNEDTPNEGEQTGNDETNNPTDEEDEKPSILLLSDQEVFDHVRRQTIVSTMQEHFAYYINEHNTYTKRLGINYKFAFPLINQEDWYNTVDDVGVFAFIQGYEVQRGKYTYNQHAFSGARIYRHNTIYGATVDGEKVFYNDTCGYDYQSTEIFNSKKDAAKAGYRELSCLNKTTK